MNGFFRRGGACALAALTLAGCGGGSDPDRADHQIFEDAELHGGSFRIDASLPAGGGALGASNYFIALSSSGLAASPTSAPQKQNPSYASMLAGNPVPAKFSNGLQQWYLAKGAIVSRTFTTQRAVSYVGSTVQLDFYADDNQTVVRSVQWSDFKEVPLEGLLSAAPAELTQAFPLTTWQSDGYLASTASWQAGSFYYTHATTLLADMFNIANCKTSQAIDGQVPTQANLPTGCATETSLTNFFPAEQLNAAGVVTEKYAATDGQFQTVQNLPAWIANNPLPAVTSATTAYRMYVLVGGVVYSGVVERAGTTVEYVGADGSAQSDRVQLNATALASVQQGLTGNGRSCALTPSTGCGGIPQGSAQR